MRRLGRLAAVVTTSMGGLLILLPAAAAAEPSVPPPPVPPGYRLAMHEELTPGMDRLQLIAEQPPRVVNVARVGRDAPVTLRAVLSNEQVAGQAPLLERTSSMCVRVGCLVALNGDFAAVGSDEPIGGLVTAGQLLRSPSNTHHQLSVTRAGDVTAGPFEWHGTLVPTDLRPLSVEGVNVAQGENRVVLYSPAFAPATRPAGPTTAIEIRMVEPAGPLLLGQTTMVELVALAESAEPMAIPAGGALLAGDGTGAEALRNLWARVQSGSAGGKALLRLETSGDVVESLGGSPILLRDGKRWFHDAADNFTRGRHPRTLVGWDGEGFTYLVTVDGRQPKVSVGMTLAEAADFMLALGATEAINLDGGGSTTFVQQGVVVNQPSDVMVRRGSTEGIRHLAGGGEHVVGRVERPVASALAVVPTTAVSVPVADPLAGPSLDLPLALALAPAAADPGSVPGGGLPALVSDPVPDFTNALKAGAVAANAVVAVSMAVFWSRRRGALAAAALIPRKDFH